MEKQAKALTGFLQTGKYSAVQISNALYIGDPRGVIKQLRKRGVGVKDEWRNNVLNNGRHKIYWIDNSPKQ